MASDNAAAVLGKTTGSVYVERQGTRISLAEGDTIHATDKVITDSGSTADIRFNDGSTASLSPGTTLEVKDFSFGEGAQPSFILNLAEGTMRSVSGELVKQNPEAFKIVTPQATVGIRGTELFTAVMPGGQEVHAVLHIGKGHIVSITSHDGRSIVMDSALQAVNMSDGEHGSLVKQTFQLNELQQVIKSIAPSQVQKPLQPQGVEGETDPNQPAQQSDAAPAAAATSTVVVIIHEGESATNAQIAAENTAPGAENTATPGNLLTIVEQLQGALADAGFNVAITTESMLGSDSVQGKNASDTLMSETVQETVSQVIDKPVESGKGETTVPPDPSPMPPMTPDPVPPVPDPVPPVNPDPTPPVDPDPTPPVDPDPTPPVDPDPTPPVDPDPTPPVDPDPTPPVDPDPTPPVDPDPGPPVDPDPGPAVKYVTYNGADFGIKVAAMDGSVGADHELNVTVNGTLGFGGELIANSLGLTTTDSSHGFSAGDTILVNGDVQGNVYGDTKTVTATNDALIETFGGDTITVGSVMGGSIFGDTGEVSAGSNGTIQFGDDVIKVTGNMVGGTIVGDVGVVNNTNSRDGLLLKFGEDNITISRDLVNGRIYGDSDSSAQNIYAYTPEGAADTITVKGDMGSLAGALIVGDFGEINGGGGRFDDGYHSIKGGDDTISVEGALISGDIYGDSKEAKSTPTDPSLHPDNDPGKYKVDCGDDKITVGSMSGGRIVGDIGVINGGSEIALGNDIITVNGVMTGGEIYGDYVSKAGGVTLAPGTAGAPAGNDTITVSGGIAVAANGNTVIDGGAGNDIITTGSIAANDSAVALIDGGVGDDTIQTGNITVNDNAEITIDGGDGVDNITTSTITISNSGKLIIQSGGGSDPSRPTLKDSITTGSITMQGTGQLSIIGGIDSDVINAGSITTSGSASVIVNGGSGEDHITLGAVNVQNGTVNVNGGDGTDVITVSGMRSGSGQITLSGGDGLDTITVNEGIQLSSDAIVSITGDDTASPTGGADTIHINASASDDPTDTAISLADSSKLSISGAAGDDAITVTGKINVSGSATLTIGGGIGEDNITLGTLNVQNGTMNVNGGDGADTITVGGIRSGNGQTTLSGGDGLDTITVNDGVQLSGGAVVSITGDGGNDTIYINASATDPTGTAISMTGGGADLTISGGVGNDAITVTGKTDISTNARLTINGDAGEDHITLGAVNVQSGFLNVNGGADNDTIATGDIKLVSGGMVTISGDTGDDTINTGILTTVAGSGTITIDGGSGADIITVGGYDGRSGPANDSLVINLGEDSVKDEFNLTADNISGTITINDYDAAVDVIRLVGLPSNGVAPASLALSADKDIFSMTLNNGSKVYINGDFSSSGSALDVFNHLCAQSALPLS